MNNNYLKLLHRFCYLLLVVVAAGCGAKQTLKGVFKNQSPYERYASSLKDAKLHETALGKDWIKAGEAALQDSILITLPFKETGYFAADKPRALGYKLQAKRGERIVVNLELRAKDNIRVFMDLFEAPASNTAAPDRVASADSSMRQLQYDVEEDLQHILRLQPELLRSGQYTVTIRIQATLAFPVPEKTSRNISSIWGDPRDGGARAHEGVDIFAPRGTPAIAAAPGIVTRTGTTPRGGKVVWLSDLDRRQNLYYAHLDSQLVSTGQRVQTGDTLGLIGNTGNASSTAPHLHFGIYRSGRGATNPYPYLHQPSQPVPAVTIDASQIGNWVRIKPRRANLRLQPSEKAAIYKTLPQHTPLQVTGGADSYYRIQLPGGKEAYISASVVEPAAQPIRNKKLVAGTDLLDEAHLQAAPKDSIPAGSSVAVLGITNQFELVKTGAGETGWINIKP